MNENGHPIGPFVADVERAIAAERPRVVIVDLRFDQGGDFTTTAGLMSRLAHLAPTVQRIYVLTSGPTFSAGETSAALAKEHGEGKVTWWESLWGIACDSGVRGGTWFCRIPS